MPFWLGLILPVCSVAGVTSATIPAQWPLLSIVLGRALWRSGRMTCHHGLGLIFMAYAAFSLTWSIQPLDSVFGLWQAAIWALAFWFGSTSLDLSPLWRGLAIGLTISSAVAVAQAMGWDAIPFRERPAGLLYNPNVQGAMIALTVLALVSDRAFAYIPAMFPGLWLAQSRGAWLVLGIGLLAKYLHWSTVLLVLCAGAAVALAISGKSDVQRLWAWRAAIDHLTLFGAGIGSFVDLVILTDPPVRPEYAHNDYLQLVFELGVGAIPVYAIVVAVLARTEAAYWPIFVAFAALGMFFYPLYCAPLSFVGAIVAGHVLRRHDRDVAVVYRGRPDLLARLPEAGCGHAASWGAAIPVQPGNQAEATGAVM